MSISEDGEMVGDVYVLESSKNRPVTNHDPAVVTLKWNELVINTNCMSTALFTKAGSD